jgi:MHS family shikimate/dehydroshikimate transporter-like MFS transporter
MDMTSTTTMTREAQATGSSMQQIVWASALDTAVEWYDFFLYGTAAVLVFNKLFFPNFDPVVGTIAALGSYAVGFVARPVGGAIFGHFGDRVGRKALLMLTMIIMGSGTYLIGCLPTYQQIGIAAPILLTVFRLLQGIGIGGEWGGAVLMVIENSDRDRRGLFGSLVQIGAPAGLVLSTLAFSGVSKLPEAQFLSWGWRIPFLISFVLVFLGLFIRMRLYSGFPGSSRAQGYNRHARRACPGAGMEAIPDLRRHETFRGCLVLHSDCICCLLFDDKA